MSRRPGWGLSALLLGAACLVPMGDDVHYRCADDGDCGGDGYVCVEGTGQVRWCCLASGPEVCGDGVDNDCDGLVDGEDDWPAEICNGKDENCNGEIDETFFFQFDDANCGSCNHACAPPVTTCVNGECR